MGSINKVYTLLLIAIIAASSPLIIQPAKAQVENVGTSCSIIVDDVVEGQPVIAVIQIFPAPPSGEIFNDLTVWMTSPMQGVWGNGGNGPWSKGHISTDINGKATVTFDIITFIGYWNIGLYFEGQYFANNTIYYQPINSQRGFTVSSAQTPTPTEIPTLGPVQKWSAGDGGTNVNIITIQNQSLLNNPIQLLFCVKALVLPYSFGNIGYSLDGGTVYNVRDFINETRVRGEADDVTVWAEVTLPKLSEGSHAVSVYYGYQFSGINQRYEVIAYSTVNFLVSSNSPTPIPSPTANPTQTPTSSSAVAEFLVPTAIVFAIIVAVVLALVLKKKQQNSKLTNK